MNLENLPPEWLLLFLLVGLVVGVAPIAVGAAASARAVRPGEAVAVRMRLPRPS